MSCPYSDEQLDYWDGVCNPMGEDCYTCEEYDCDHNENLDNPLFIHEMEINSMGPRKAEELAPSVSGPRPRQIQTKTSDSVGS